MEEITCKCGWSGTEDDLEMDYYEEFESVMPLASLCPSCRNEID